MTYPIFISYKRVDKDKVFEIKDFIETHTGISCWIDLDGIESDALFEDVIIEAIDSCEVFLYFYSNEHLKISDYDNDWTIKELDFAQEEKKRIVFINLDNTPLNKKFKFRYRYKQQVDAQDQSRLDKLVSDIRNWFNVSSDPSVKSEKSTAESESEEGMQPKSLNKIVEESTLDNSLPKSLLFEIDGKKIYFILSEDQTFYMGNLMAEENDVSWWENKWIKAGGGAALYATAAVLSVSASIALLILSKGFKSIFSKSKVSVKTCENLSKQIGYNVDVPTPDELKGVKEEARKTCIVLRLKDNPALLAKD